MANAITAVRIVCGIGILFQNPYTGWFFVLYLLGGVSDALDGFVARKRKTASRFGASLDTVADFVFMAAVLIRIWKTLNLPLGIVLWIALIAFVKVLNVAVGFVFHKRFMTAHTVMNKLCGGLLFAIPFAVRFLPPPVPLLWMVLTCTSATVAAVQETYIIKKGENANNYEQI